jgi:hypothetical protein
MGAGFSLYPATFASQRSGDASSHEAATSRTLQLAPLETCYLELVVDRKASKRNGFLVSLLLNDAKIDSWLVRVYSSSWGSVVNSLDAEQIILDSVTIANRLLIAEKWTADGILLESRYRKTAGLLYSSV